MYLDKNGNVIKDMSTLGYKAIGVPGSVAGMVYAQKHWGKLTLSQVMQPAIRLARDGFTLDYAEAEALKHSGLEKFPESRRIFERDGDYYQAGEVFRQPELAKTLERIAENPDDFYRGSLARELATAMQKGGGLITDGRPGRLRGQRAAADSRHAIADTRSSARLRRLQAVWRWSKASTYWKATILRKKGTAPPRVST